MAESGTRFWGFPVRTDQDPERLYADCEGGEGGFYPVGANRLWHGGVHLHGAGTVHAPAAGRIVAARLEAQIPADGTDEGRSSRNFVLIAHTLGVDRVPSPAADGSPLGGSPGPAQAAEVTLYSLAMHLAPLTLSEDDNQTAQVPWLCALFRSHRFVTVQALTFRSEPSLTCEPHKDAAGANILVPGGASVRALDDGATTADGWGHVEYQGRQGWIRVEGESVYANLVVDAAASDLVAALRAGNVVKLDQPVAKGDVIGHVGPLAGEDTLHYEVFSGEPLFLPEMNAFSLLADTDRDALCDVPSLLADLDEGGGRFLFVTWKDGNVDGSESKAAAPNMRELVCQHISEWAADDWQFLLQKPFRVAQRDLEQTAREWSWFHWWRDAEAAGVDLPARAQVTTYHPLRFGGVLEEHLRKRTCDLALEVLPRGIPRYVSLWRVEGETRTAVTDAGGEVLILGTSDEGRVVFSDLVAGDYVAKACLHTTDPYLTEPLSWRTPPEGLGSGDLAVTLAAGEDQTLTWGDAASDGQSIFIDGVAHAIGAPVLTWHDPGGFNAYTEHSWFGRCRPYTGTADQVARENDVVSKSRCAVCDVETVDLGKRYTAGSFPKQHFVVHFDACHTSRQAFEVLQDQRWLSAQFLLDLDGTLYQTMDSKGYGWHAGWFNRAAVGVEIAHLGPLQMGTTNRSGVRACYQHHADGVCFHPAASYAQYLRVPEFVVRPARPEKIEGVIQGDACEQYDFTAEQYATLAPLLETLERQLAISRVTRPETGYLPELPEPSLEARNELSARVPSGILAHYHLSRKKHDPGPAFDWTKAGVSFLEAYVAPEEAQA